MKNIPRELQALAKSVKEVTLSNGLRVRLVPNHDVPTCSLYTFFRVGSRNERPGITGISHLFEHMMFNGAKKYGPGAFDRVLEASGGTSNAYTSTDMTVYYEDFMAEALPTVLDLESDRMRSLQVTPTMLESERQVVLEERRLRVDNDIMGSLDEELSALVWKAHPYQWPVIGWQRDIENISREDCLAYFRTYYAPNNATLYLSGDFDEREALALIKKQYGTIRPGPTPLAVVDSEPQQNGERRAEVHYPAQSVTALYAWRGPKATDRDALTLDVIQYALAVGQSSRLIKSMVFDKEVAVSVSVDWGWRIDPGAFTVAIELKQGASLGDAERELFGTLKSIATKGLTADELAKAKNNLGAHLVRELATHSGRAHALGQYEMLLGDWRRGLELAQAYETVTSADVQAAAAKYLSASQRNSVALVPAAKAAA